MPSASRPLTGVVLAGGTSVRMGTDKALLELGGRTLVSRVVTALAGCCTEVLVASGDGLRLPGPGLRQVADVTPGAGPLGGLVAGLEAAGDDLVAVVAVDMPFAEPAVLRLLAERWTGEPAVVPVARGRLQPLHAVWARAAAPALRLRIDAGLRSPTGAAEALGARLVAEPEWRAAGVTGAWADDIDDPAGWQALLTAVTGGARACLPKGVAGHEPPGV